MPGIVYTAKLDKKTKQNLNSTFSNTDGTIWIVILKTETQQKPDSVCVWARHNI